MELHEYLRVFRRQWPTMVAVVTLAIIGAAVATLVSQPVYTATVKLFFGVQGNKSVSDLALASGFIEKQMNSYAEVASSPLVLDPVIKRLGLDTDATRLAEEVTATSTSESVILEVAVANSDPEEAVLIANAIGEQMSALSSDLTTERSAGPTATVRATIFSPAEPPTQATSPRPLQNLLQGLGLGLILAVPAAFARNSFGSRVRVQGDLSSLRGTPFLGAIPSDPVLATAVIPKEFAESAAASDAIRRLRVQLQARQRASMLRTLIVTSTVPGEGKTTVAANLAISMANAGQRVLLIEANFRSPYLVELLGLSSAEGLAQVLQGQAKWNESVQRWGASTLDVLPAGSVAADDPERLGSSAMVTLLDQVRGKYDQVLLDSSALLPSADSFVLSQLAGDALIVVGAGEVRRSSLRKVIDSLSAVDISVIGTVLNKEAVKGTKDLSPRKVPQWD